MSAHSHRAKRAGWRARRRENPFAAAPGEKTLPEALADLTVPGEWVQDAKREAPAQVPEGAYPYEDIPVPEALTRPVRRWTGPEPDVLRQTLDGLRNLDVSGNSHPFDAPLPSDVREMLSALPEGAAEPRPALSPAQAFRDDKRTLPVFRGTVRQCGMGGLLRLPYRQPAPCIAPVDWDAAMTQIGAAVDAALQEAESRLTAVQQAAQARFASFASAIGRRAAVAYEPEARQPSFTPRHLALTSPQPALAPARRECA